MNFKPHMISTQKFKIIMLQPSPSTSTLIIVMEYAANGDLRRLIKARHKRQQHIPESSVMRWFCMLLSALNYIHRNKVLHRDLKTSGLKSQDLEEESYMWGFGNQCLLL
jgi:serine/threonine protein kinase